MDNKLGVIEKTLTIIKAFVDIQPEWGVRELAKELDFPVSTLHRFLLSLQEEGILESNSSTGKYSVGFEMIRISSVITANVDILKTIKPFMRKLVDQHNETICLVLYNNKLRKIAFVDKVTGLNPLQYVVNLGEFQSVPYGASGKSIFAFLDYTEREAIYQQEGFSEEQQLEVEKELITIRLKGYASTHDQRITGAKGIAAPIINSTNQAIGSLVFTVPKNRFEILKEQEIVHDLLESARQISRILGKEK